MSESIRTYQTRPKLIEDQADLLAAAGALYGRIVYGFRNGSSGDVPDDWTCLAVVQDS